MSVSPTDRPRRTGLALSGGGFRASFFHIGVLAQLARYGILKHIEVISTVSGGSIIGALYYLELQRLIETTGDNPLDDPERADAALCGIVERIEKRFLAAVERNVRARAFLNPFKIIQMALPFYSRSDRIAEMYNELFYKEFAREKQWPTMPECMVAPGGFVEFSPEKHNEARVTKVPMLLLNATSLNTGHNWRFEAHMMGEYVRDDMRSKVIDKNTWLARHRYTELDDRLRYFPLPHAVAASTAVPGLFPPLSISEMYEKHRVKLADGGVHDNQGLQGLIDRQCTRFIVSDASGQLKDEPAPTSFEIGVLIRSASVLSDRVREEQLHAMMTEMGRPYLFLHLRRGVIPQVVHPWKKGQEKLPGSTTQDRVKTGIPDKITPHQERLAYMRTDLDSFTEVEAYSLMLNGYRMVERDLLDRFDPFADLVNVRSPDDAPPHELDLRFLDLERRLAAPRSEEFRARYEKHLKVAAHTALKVFRLAPGRAWTAAVAATAVALAALALVYALAHRLAPHDPWRWFVILLAVPFEVSLVACVVTLVRARWFPRAHDPCWRFSWATLGRMLGRAAIAVVVPPIVWVHLRVFDRIFRAAGRLDRLG